MQRGALYVFLIGMTVVGCTACSPNTSQLNNGNQAVSSLALSAEKPSLVALNTFISIGAVGDVKYSILDPEKFVEKNGEGWVLMMGQEIKGTDLCKDTGICNLPDARGMFIRGMNLKRPPGEGDTEGDRKVGSRQDDVFKSHGHDISPRLNLGHSINGNGGSWKIDSDDGPSWNGTDIDVKAEDAGDKETRPRNVALYTYIKVSEPATRK